MRVTKPKPEAKIVEIKNLRAAMTRFELSTLFVVFLILKLVGVISWSWAVITLPITIPLTLYAGLIVMLGILKMIKASTA